MMTTAPQAIPRWPAIAARLATGVVLVVLAAAAAPSTAWAQPPAPPTIATFFSSANVAQNSTIFAEFTITNPNQAATLTGISFPDALPAGLVVATPNDLSNDCGGTVTAVPGSSSITLTGGTVAPAGPPPQIARGAAAADPASGFCNISIGLLVTGTGTISNTTGSISANESGVGNPSNTATIQVVQPPTASAAFGAATIPVGGTTSLTFNVANPNANITLRSVDLSDSLPAGLVVASPNGLTGSCVGSATIISANPGSSSIELSNHDLAPSSSCSFAVNVTGTTAGTKNDTTNPITGLFDDGTGTFFKATGGTASAALTVIGPPTLMTAFGAKTIAVGSSTPLTYTVGNPNASPVSGVAFADTLPAGLVVSTPNGLSGSCGGGTITATAGSGSVALSGATLAGGATCTISVNVTGTSEGVKQESTMPSSTNGGTGAPASASLFVGLPPSITTSFTPTSITLGATTTLSFTVKNPNAVATLSGIAVPDTLPAGLVVASPSGAQGSCGGGTLTAVPGGGMFSFTGGQLAPGASCTVSLGIKATRAGTEQNTAGPVSSAQSGVAGSASAALTVIAPKAPKVPKAPTTLTLVQWVWTGSGTQARVSATLTDPGTPLAGERVSFATGGRRLCTATTGRRGVASCTFNAARTLRRLRSSGYEATFGGDANHLPSSARIAPGHRRPHLRLTDTSVQPQYPYRCQAESGGRAVIASVNCDHLYLGLVGTVAKHATGRITITLTGGFPGIPTTQRNISVTIRARPHWKVRLLVPGRDHEPGDLWILRIAYSGDGSHATATTGSQLLLEAEGPNGPLNV